MSDVSNKPAGSAVGKLTPYQSRLKIKALTLEATVWEIYCISLVPNGGVSVVIVCCTLYSMKPSSKEAAQENNPLLSAQVLVPALEN